MIWSGLLDAVHHMLSLDVVLGLFGGSILGYLIGSIPGLSSSIGIALLIPFTYSLSPVTSIVLLVTLYMATEYAGAIPAILMNTPGVPAAAVTAMEGYPMRMRGEAGTALTMSILSAGFGSVCATLMLIAATCGLLGFLLYTWLLFRVARDAFAATRLRESAARSAGAGVLGTLAAMLVASLFTNGLIYPPALIFLWSVAGVSARWAMEPKRSAL